jgi:hypothetical protein
MTLVGPINSFIHIVMYAYYFATAMWPEYKNNLWWKKHLTQMQMVCHITPIQLALKPFLTLNRVRVIAQALRRWLPTAAARVRAPVG